MYINCDRPGLVRWKCPSPALLSAGSAPQSETPAAAAPSALEAAVAGNRMSCDQQEDATVVMVPYRLAHGTKAEALPFWMIVLSMAAGCVPAGLVFTSGENVTQTSYQSPDRHR